MADGLLERDALLAQLGVLARRVARGSSGEVVLLRGEALTGRQRQVFDLLVAGRSNRETAAELHISPKTVGHHVEAILAKLGVDNRIHAVAYALQSQAASQSQS